MKWLSNCVDEFVDKNNIVIKGSDRHKRIFVHTMMLMTIMCFLCAFITGLLVRSFPLIALLTIAPSGCIIYFQAVVASNGGIPMSQRAWDKGNLVFFKFFTALGE